MYYPIDRRPLIFHLLRDGAYFIGAINIANDFYSLSSFFSGEAEEKKIVSMEGQLQEHLEKMQRTKAEREKLECANGEITKNVSCLYSL